jgi:hypothetical protein
MALQLTGPGIVLRARFTLCPDAAGFDRSPRGHDTIDRQIGARPGS